MEISHTDKNVLVTGGATGIGRAIAEAFSQSGATVFINHLGQQDKIREIQKEATIKGDWSADVSNRNTVNAMVADIEKLHGNIDILINNAAISNPSPFLETVEADWDEVINTNLKGTVFASQAVIPGMLKKGSGCIKFYRLQCFQRCADYPDAFSCPRIRTCDTCQWHCTRPGHDRPATR